GLGLLDLTGQGSGRVRVVGGAAGSLAFTGSAQAVGGPGALATAAQRVWTVPGEIRVLVVALDDRTLTVPAEDRTLTFS
ncbi:hypothetical protein, partial [Phenylobacterium sp.]|uniref:hypothetical protein n=1 Tax=Phenylobacterium sp. TaxID=1871053 RepID=UPI0025F8FD77